MSVHTFPVPEAHLAVRLDLDDASHQAWLLQRHLDGESAEQLAQVIGLSSERLGQLLLTAKARHARRVSPNRAERRRLERARRRRDKLIEPKLGHVEHAAVERPAPPVRERKQPKPKPDEIVIDDPNDHIIADELVEGDGQGDVLFEESEFYGEFNFRDSILDQLDRYWFYLERMRLHANDSYEMYRQIGAILVPPLASGSRQAFVPIHKLTEQELEDLKRQIVLSPWFKKTRPSWGCIAFGTDPLIDKRESEHKILDPKFLYFSRYDKAPPAVQARPEPGDIYNMTVWWDTAKKSRKWGVPCDIPIFVSADGERISVLKLRDTKMVQIKQQHHFLHTTVPQPGWYFPKAYQDWAESYGLDVDLHLAHLFCHAMRQFESSHYAMARVAVTNGNLTATFGINPRRLAYFFQDRDIVTTVSGQRKRILHFVRPHVREDGVPVKAHFRGSRAFEWANYKVYITIPGKDHFLLPEFNVPVNDGGSRKAKRGDNHVYPPELGARLNNVVHGNRRGLSGKSRTDL